MESEKELSTGDVNRVLTEFGMFVLRGAVLLWPVYVCGALGLSASWLVLSVLLWGLWEKNRQRKGRRVNDAIHFVENEGHVIQKEMVQTLNSPAWIQFSEVEKAAWINKILTHAWPFFGVFMDKLLRDSIQPAIRQSSPHLKTFNFTRVHFGHRAPSITGVQVHTDEVDKREVILDLKITYVGDINIDADLKPRISVGVKEIQLQGLLRVILQPLIGQSPLVGGVSMFFIRRPTLNLNWTGMTNLLDSPALRPFSESAILDIIASYMVLPNRMCFPLIDQVKVDQMRFPLPRGVVRVHVLEAQELVAMDTVMLGLVKGKSDPYAVLRVGNQRFRTKTVKETLNPRWNEVYEFIVHEAPGQELEVELFDKDTDKDDFMGRFKLDFGEVKKDKEIKRWFPLQEIESGKVLMKLQWLSLQTDLELLKETPEGCACAMLAVYLDSASQLPKDQSEFTQLEKSRKQSKEARLTKRQSNPSSYVKFSVDEQSQKSKIVYNSRDPVFEECFTFFVHNLESQMLNIQVMVPEKKTSLGMLNLPLSRLLGISDLTLDQRLPLERSGANSQLKLKAVLRILKLEKPAPKVQNPPVPKPQVGPQANALQSQQPQQTFSQNGLNSSKLELNNQASTLSQMPNSASSTGGLQSECMPSRRGSFLSPETRGLGSTKSSGMRRYDSHSLLSENSIASSRFDLTEGVPYPDLRSPCSSMPRTPTGPPQSSAIMNHQGSFGQIQMSIRYATLRNKLIVTVNNCRNLFPCSDSGSDTYVRIYLLPDQKWKNRMRTKVKKKTVDPIFDEKFETSVPLEEAKTRKLDVSVKNNRMFHTRERKEIGMVLIDLAQVDLVKGFTNVYELTIPGLKKTI